MKITFFRIFLLNNEKNVLTFEAFSISEFAA